jgi:penicillin-binding protein 1A
MTKSSRGFVLEAFMGKLIAFFLAMVGLFWGFWAWTTRDMPDISKALQNDVNPNQFTQVFASDGTAILSYGQYRQKKLPLAQVSPHFIDALLATEDRRFFHHNGVDPIAIGRAMVRNLTTHRFAEGGSTLTQQLARNLFLTDERSYDRKIKEAALALEIEKHLSKDEILEMYVNQVYFGEGAYGIQAASEVYFNKEPAQLTMAEAALLAGLPQAPSRYDPYSDPDLAKRRRNEVLQNLVETGVIKSNELSGYQEKPLRLNAIGRQSTSANRAPYFNHYIMDLVQRQFQLDEQGFWHSGLKIYTTLDWRAQSLAQRVLKQQMDAAGRVRRGQQGAILSLNPNSGAILVYVGGKDYSQSQFDRVVQAKRSPGSLFKVFTYTAAIESGMLPNHMQVDEPLTLGDWTPQNYDKQHHGRMTLARALATSNNIIAIKTLQELGPNKAVDVAQRMGVNSPMEANLALTLGGMEVTPIEITSAIGVLATHGTRAEPYGIDKIMDRDGNVLYQHQPFQSPVLNRPTADTMVAMLQGVVQFGTGRAANIGTPVAGKTGTSDDYRDAWFVGFTPDIVTGVWVGNDDNSPMPGITGGSLPAQIWAVVMRGMLAGQLPKPFDLAFAQPVAAEDFGTTTGQDIDPNTRIDADPDAANLPDGQPGDGTATGGAVSIIDGSTPNGSGNDPNMDNNSGNLTPPNPPANPTPRGAEPMPIPAHPISGDTTGIRGSRPLPPATSGSGRNNSNQDW